MHPARSLGGLARILTLLLVLGSFGLVPGPAVLADEQNRAGLVVQHGDGRVLYLSIEFTEPEITGAELLLRSGLDLTTAGYSGLGEAVCRIEGEGCPADNCFCESYGSETWFWRYHRLAPDGTWTALPVGPASRSLQDGDVDGWIWSPGDRTLPAVTMDQIIQIIESQNVPAATAPAVTDTSEPDPTATTEPVARGVEIDPTAGIQPIDREPRSTGSGLTGYLAFAVILVVIVAAGGWAAIGRNRRAE